MVTPLNELRRPNEYYYVQGVVQDLVLKQGKGRYSAQVELSDDSGGVLTLRFFNYRPRWIAVFQKGVWVRAYGQLWGEYRRKSMIHPDFKNIQLRPRSARTRICSSVLRNKGIDEQTHTNINSEDNSRSEFATKV